MEKEAATMQQKVNIIRKLNKNGYSTEKDLLKLTLDTVVDIENISITDIKIIIEIQKSVKNGTFFSYLSGASGDE